jgi:hypothetical protein
MFKIHKLAGYGPKEPVFPGKMWFVDEMDHIESFQMGEIYPSGYNNEQATLIYSQQRTTVNEINLGMPQAGTPGTATSDLARIQEGSRKFDFVYQNFTEFTEEIITDVADIIQQHGPRQVEYFDTAEDGPAVKQILSLPQSWIREGLVLKLKASTQQQNRVLDRQNWVQLAPLLQQYYVGMLQLAQEGGLPQIGGIIVLKGMNAITEAMKQILESYDVRNINRILVTEVEEMVKNGLQQIGAGPGADGGSTASGGQQGVGSLIASLQSLGGIGSGLPNQL